jgi:protein-L-isoaspartate(D-aspartate) O-methyltransferase
MKRSAKSAAGEGAIDEGKLDVVRRAYAKQVMAAAGVEDARVEAAFAAVRREDFLAPAHGRSGGGAGILPRRALTRFISTPTM